MAEGIDRAVPFTKEADLDCLIDNGVTFIGRYYKPKHSDGSISDYVLTRDEALLISGKGLFLVTVYQDSGNDAGHFTYDKGINDCSEAIERAIEVGQPAGTPIYFAVDYDAAGSSTIDNVKYYFYGVIDKMQEYQKSRNSGWCQCKEFIAQLPKKFGIVGLIENAKGSI
jgi:hypothetical protein